MLGAFVQGDVESGQGWEVENKYKTMYEDSINPFAAFSTKVSDHRQHMGAYTATRCDFVWLNDH